MASILGFLLTNPTPNNVLRPRAFFEKYNDKSTTQSPCLSQIFLSPVCDLECSSGIFWLYPTTVSKIFQEKGMFVSAIVNSVNNGKVSNDAGGQFGLLEEQKGLGAGQGEFRRQNSLSVS